MIIHTIQLGPGWRFGISLEHQIMARMVGDVFNGIGIWSGLTVVSSLRSFLTTFLVPSIEVVSQSGSMGYVKWRLGRRLALMSNGVREGDLTCIQYRCSGHVIHRKHPKSSEGLGQDEEDEKKAIVGAAIAI
jgi:hypothetical protein